MQVTHRPFKVLQRENQIHLYLRLVISSSPRWMVGCRELDGPECQLTLGDYTVVSSQISTCLVSSKLIATAVYLQ